MHINKRGRYNDQDYERIMFWLGIVVYVMGIAAGWLIVFWTCWLAGILGIIITI